jgi:hypothetical protein
MKAAGRRAPASIDNFFISPRNRKPRNVFERGAKGKWRQANMLKNILTAAAIGAAAIMTSTLSASAAIVCQGNVCWHTHEAYDFPHEAGIVVHEDNWHWGPHEKFAFREHEGRGYWHGGKWVTW